MLASNDFLWLVGSLCQVLRIPFDERLARVAFPPPLDRARLVEALEKHGMRTAGLRGPVDARTPMPCVAWTRSADGAAGIALVVRADGARVLCFAPGSAEPRTFSTAEFRAQFEDDLLAVAADEADPSTFDAGEAAERQRFGFAWFIPELLRHKAIWREVLLASAAIQVVGLAIPLLTQVVIDKVVVHHSIATLWAVGVGLVLFMLFMSLMTWLRQYLVLHTGNRIDAVLGDAVFRHLLRLPMAYFEARPTGTLVARLQGIESIRQFIAGAAVTLLLDCPFLVILLAVMFWYSWQLTVVALAAAAAIALLSLALTPLFRRRLDAQFLAGARVQAFVTEHVAAMATVKSLQMEAALGERYGAQLARYLSSAFATRQLANTYHTAAGALEQAMTLAILVGGALLVIDSAELARLGGTPFTIGMLVAFQMFAARMSQPLLRLAGLWQEFQQARISVRRLGDIMDAPAESADVVPRRAAAGRARGRVEFAAVDFRYTAAHPWLYRGFDAILEPGEITLVTGASGCGKSTLARLLQGYYPVAEGRILIDGVDIAHMTATELRACFGVVPQETVLFAGTVYDNLLLGNAHAGFEEVATACRQAGIAEEIERLPQGYQTRVGEHGVGLSGGQRQRIAIARALLKAPPILIFDEAASNLDGEAAGLLAQTVNALKGSATVLFIAHTVPPGLAVDRVLRLDMRAAGAER
ncbi:MAG: peptidase domain-containing ABC transporter [Burkholderiales bacterium]|nr:peptidase domain-containing ABC transporter [Burkholderiales bacterium]